MTFSAMRHDFGAANGRLVAQGDSVQVLHTLRPLIVVMAGANKFDPYKD